MATMITYSYGTRTIKLDCTQTLDAANNRSLITWTLTSNSANNDLYTTQETLVYIDGTLVASYPEHISGSTFPRGNGSASGTRYVTHGSNGAKTVSLKMEGGVGTDVGTKTASWTLTPTTPSITSAPNFTDADNPTITYSNPGGSGVSRLWAGIYYNGVAYAAWRDIPKTGSSYTFNLTNDERNALRGATPNATRTVSFIIDSVVGGVERMSSRDVTFTVSDSAGNKPTVSFSSVGRDNGDLPSAFDNVYVQGMSKVTATVTASAATGTTISQKGAIVDGVSYSGASVTSGLLMNSGSVTIKAYATDARNHTKTDDTRTITVLAYEKPSFAPATGRAGVACYRANNDGTENHASTDVWLAAKASYSSVNSLNGATMKYQYKELPSGSYNSWTNLTLVGDEYDGLISGTFNASKSYLVRVRVEDTVGNSSTVTFQIQSEDVPLSLGAGGQSVGIGRMADTNDPYSLKIGWDTTFEAEEIHIYNDSGVQYPVRYDCVRRYAGTAGEAGYIKVAEVTLSDSASLWANESLRLFFSQRGNGLCEAIIRFTNATDAASTSLSFIKVKCTDSAEAEVKATRTGDDVFNIFVKKSSTNDQITVFGYEKGAYSAKRYSVTLMPETQAQVSTVSGAVATSLPAACMAYEDHDFTISGGISAGGTIGERVNQLNYTPSLTPVSVCIVNIGNSSYFNPLTFIYSGKVYVNYYRASTSSATESQTKVTVRVFF